MLVAHAVPPENKKLHIGEHFVLFDFLSAICVYRIKLLGETSNCITQHLKALRAFLPHQHAAARSAYISYSLSACVAQCRINLRAINRKSAAACREIDSANMQQCICN